MDTLNKVKEKRREKAKRLFYAFELLGSHEKNELLLNSA
jgi:hypothetical protein